MQDIYKVTFGSQRVGFFVASTWNEAAKQAARQHSEETGEKQPWVHYTAIWVNPKHYEEEGVPEAMYAEQEEGAEA